MTEFSAAQKTVLTGTPEDQQFAAQVIGKDIPIFIGGEFLGGCRLIEGPFINTAGGAGFVDMIVSPCSVATPEATRELTSIRLNGTESFTSDDGGATWAPVAAGPFDDVEINVLYGSETQTPFASSVARYGARAVPYRSHVCVELKNVPLAPFANLIPFVSVFVHESDFLTRNDALAKLARHARFNTDEYEFEVSGQDKFWIVIKPSTFIGYLQDLQRTVGRNWNILPADKLRVYENDAAETPVTLTRADVVADSIRYKQHDPLSIQAIRTLGYIDTGRDNDFYIVKAVRARFPVPLTASVGIEALDVPIGMEDIDAKQAVNKSLLIDDFARDRIVFKAMPHRRGLQPGDIFSPDFDDEIDWEAARIIAVARNAADFTSDIEAERIRLALLVTGPSITSDGAAATASITVDEEDGTAVTTVTATDADEEGAFSIVGGDDAALFTIDADTGVLTFLVEPDFEDPQDADANNTYVVIVQVTGNGLTDTQTITVTVTNVLETPGEIFGPNYIIIV